MKPTTSAAKDKATTATMEHHVAALLNMLRRKRTLLAGTGLVMVILMTIETTTHRSLSNFLTPSSAKKDFIYTSPRYHAQGAPIISWEMTPVPFEEPTYDEIFNTVYQCHATRPGDFARRLPRKEMESSVKSQMWFHTGIKTSLNILVMGDSVAMQMGQVLQEAMEVNPATRNVMRLLEDETEGHESLFWGTSRSGGGSGGYRLLHWWLRRNHGKALPETSGGGWILTDVEQLLKAIQHRRRSGRHLRESLHARRRRRRSEDESGDDDGEGSEEDDDSDPSEHHHHRHHHHHGLPNPKKRRDPKAEEKRDPKLPKAADERKRTPPTKKTTSSPIKKKTTHTSPPPAKKTTSSSPPAKKTSSSPPPAKKTSSSPPPPKTKTTSAPPATKTTSSVSRTRTDFKVEKTTGRAFATPETATADNVKGAMANGPMDGTNPRVILKKEDVAADFMSRHNAGKVDVLIFRVSQPWMHWSTMTPENMQKTIEVARELLGVRVVVFLTIPFSNNIVTSEDIQKMKQSNSMIRQFSEAYRSSDVTVLTLDIARLHDTLLRENAVEQGYEVKAGKDWPIADYEFALDTLQQSAAYYSHSIGHVCGDRVITNSMSCSNNNMVTVDGQHLCMKTFGGRLFAGMACVIRCAYTYAEDRKELGECERACNDQYMTLQPLDAFMTIE